MRMLKIFFLFISLFSYSILSAKKLPSADSLRVLGIKNNELVHILDSIIEHEKKCDYYDSDMYFWIHFQSLGDTSIVQFEAGFNKVKIGDEQGCFDHAGHLVFVCGEYLDKTIFFVTNKKKKYDYYNPKEKYNDTTEQLILDIIEDDTFSVWIYYYVNNNFTLKKMHTFCDKK